MALLILTASELVVLAAMLGGLIRVRSLKLATVPLRTDS
jgi:hypothetical protein